MSDHCVGMEYSAATLQPAVVRSRPYGAPDLGYAVVGLAVFGLWIGFYLVNPFGFDSPGRDTWHHVAVLRELMQAPFAPSNPHIPTDEASRYFTPVNLVAALFGKALDLSPYRLFGFVGAASCVGLIVACQLFARRYFEASWAPVILLLMLLFAWGTPMGHAGLYNYESWLSSAAYPSNIALVLGLFSWSLALDQLRARINAPAVIGLASLSAVILLTHQLSGVFMLTGLGAIILFREQASVRSRALLLGAVGLGTLASLAWPYFSILDVLTSASDVRWRSPYEPMNSLSTALALMAPSLLGILGFRNARGRVRWELLLPAALFGVLYAYLELQGSAIAHRIPTAIILFNQLGLVWLILNYGQRTEREGGARRAVGAAACLLIAMSATWSGSLRLQELGAREQQGSLLAMAELTGRRLPHDAITFATETVVFPLQSTGRRVVSIPRPEPGAPSLGARQQATDRFFAITTPQDERLRLIKQWGATHVMFHRRDVRSSVAHDLRRLGRSMQIGRSAELVTISPLHLMGVVITERTAHAS
jgi:hypothetical protein